MPHVCTQQRTAEDNVDVPVSLAQVQNKNKVGDEQFTDKMIEVPIVLLSKVAIIKGGLETVEVSQVLFNVKAVSVPMEKVIDVPVPNLFGEMMEVIRSVPQDRNSERDATEIKDVIVSSLMEEMDV